MCFAMILDQRLSREVIRIVRLRVCVCVCAVHALLRTPAFNLTEVIRKWRQVNGCKRENLEKNLVIRCQNIPLFGYL